MRVLFYQGADLDGRDFVYVDGKLSSDNEGYNLLASLLNKTTNVHKIPWVKKVEGYHFIKGSLTSRDQAGRIMTFVYCSDTYSRKEFSKLLSYDLEQAGISQDTESELAIKEYVRKGEKMSNIILLSSVLLILLFTIVLLINIHTK